MQLHLGHWHLAVTHRTPTPRLDALRDDELMAWAAQHLRNRRRQPTTTRHHIHRHPTRDGGTKTIRFDDHPSGSYGGYVNVTRDGSTPTVDVSGCPTCRDLPPLKLTAG